MLVAAVAAAVLVVAAVVGAALLLAAPHEFAPELVYDDADTAHVPSTARLVPYGQDGAAMADYQVMAIDDGGNVKTLHVTTTDGFSLDEVDIATDRPHAVIVKSETNGEAHRLPRMAVAAQDADAGADASAPAEGPQLIPVKLASGSAASEEAAGETAMYAAYYDKIAELQDEYDRLWRREDSTGSYDRVELLGVCFAKLVDFDADGSEELVVVYWDDAMEERNLGNGYVLEVWRFNPDDFKLAKVFSGHANMSDGAVTHLSFCFAEDSTGHTPFVFSTQYNVVPLGDGFAERVFGLVDGSELGEAEVSTYYAGVDKYRYEVNGEVVSAAKYKKKPWYGARTNYSIVGYPDLSGSGDEITDVDVDATQTAALTEQVVVQIREKAFGNLAYAGDAEASAIGFVRTWYGDWSFEDGEYSESDGFVDRCLPLIAEDSLLYQDFWSEDMTSPYSKDAACCVVEEPVAEQLSDDTYRVTVRYYATLNTVDAEAYARMQKGGPFTDVWDVTIDAQGKVTDFERQD